MSENIGVDQQLGSGQQIGVVYGNVYIQPIRSGLNALAELMQEPGVTEIASTYRTRFRIAAERIVTLDQYKRLHDQLHDLQTRCYEQIVDNVLPYFPDDRSVDTLKGYSHNLKRIIDDVNVIVQEGMWSEAETFWITNLSEAFQTLEGAAEQRARASLESAIWVINRVITIQLPTTNARLKETARILGLPELEEALTDIRDLLTERNIVAGKAGALREAPEALNELCRELDTVVEEHDWLQAIDERMRLINGSAAQQTEQLILSWPGLKRIAETLVARSEATWAAQFNETYQQLDQAIVTANPASTATAFRHFRRHANNHFFDVDRKLLQLCNELRRICEPLNRIIGE